MVFNFIKKLWKPKFKTKKLKQRDFDSLILDYVGKQYLLDYPKKKKIKRIETKRNLFLHSLDDTLKFVTNYEKPRDFNTLKYRFGMKKVADSDKYTLEYGVIGYKEEDVMEKAVESAKKYFQSNKSLSQILNGQINAIMKTKRVEDNLIFSKDNVATITRQNTEARIKFEQVEQTVNNFLLSIREKRKFLRDNVYIDTDYLTEDHEMPGDVYISVRRLNHYKQKLVRSYFAKESKKAKALSHVEKGLNNQLDFHELLLSSSIGAVKARKLVNLLKDDKKRDDCLKELRKIDIAHKFDQQQYTGDEFFEKLHDMSKDIKDNLVGRISNSEDEKEDRWYHTTDTYKYENPNEDNPVRGGSVPKKRIQVCYMDFAKEYLAAKEKLDQFKANYMETKKSKWQRFKTRIKTALFDQRDINQYGELVTSDSDIYYTDYIDMLTTNIHKADWKTLKGNMKNNQNVDANITKMMLQSYKAATGSKEIPKVTSKAGPNDVYEAMYEKIITYFRAQPELETQDKVKQTDQTYNFDQLQQVKQFAALYHLKNALKSI